MLPGRPTGWQSEWWDSVPRWEAWEEGLGQQRAGGQAGGHQTFERTCLGSWDISLQTFMAPEGCRSPSGLSRCGQGWDSEALKLYMLG